MVATWAACTLLSAARTVGWGYVAMLSSCALSLILALTLDTPRVPWTTLPLVLYGCGVQLAFPTLTLLLLDRFPDQRGGVSNGMCTTIHGKSTAQRRTSFCDGTCLHFDPPVCGVRTRTLAATGPLGRIEFCHWVLGVRDTINRHRR